MPLRVGYVREHFSSPLLQFAADDGDKTFTLVECPNDIAIALTDPLISGIANGSKAYKLVGSFVNTPLNWAVITGVKSQYQSISDLEGTTIGISRIGSGSQTMAYVTALQQAGPRTIYNSRVLNNDIRGLINSVNDGTTSAFMWEWFTTKPFADAGEVRFIGSVPTPWPSWLIAAHPSQERAPSQDVRVFLQTLSTYVAAFNTPEKRAGPNVEFIKDKFGYPEEDIKAWLATVGYPADCAAIPESVISDTLTVLEKAGVVKAPEGGRFDIANFVDVEVVKLT
ncbi:periplasmic binding protein-like II [Gloeopeniophorella convolvens]|nr:periplasmic binding protein-like II [Gloeopeniophorella convolvens]